MGAGANDGFGSFRPVRRAVGERPLFAHSRRSLRPSSLRPSSLRRLRTAEIRTRSERESENAARRIERLGDQNDRALVDASKRNPDARALSFFLSADRLDEAHAWTYAELVADVTRAANVFAALGVAADRPVAYALPNLPETHFAIWGGEARLLCAALAVNPMLEPRQVADILRFARASILVTLAPPRRNPNGTFPPR